LVSFGYDPRVRCRIEEAFPADLRDDVRAVISTAEGSGPFSVFVRGERLVIPYRVRADAAALDREETLTPIQRDILFCIFSRHHAGLIRERALRRIIRSSNDWVIPFVVQLVGEYVIEIHQVVQEALTLLNGAQYAAFLRANPEMYERTRQRVVSYWNCYYRHGPSLAPRGRQFADRTGYPAFEVLAQFDKFFEESAPAPGANSQ
jgi:hypothetical protein